METKNIIVRVEYKKTGEILEAHDCGTDERKANAIHLNLSERVNDDYRVYIIREV
jgi:hypothetical protein